jgi:hypothetical protein
VQEIAIPYSPFFGVPPSFEEWKAAQEKPAESWPECVHRHRVRKISRTGHEYAAFLVCPRDQPQCGAHPVTTAEVFKQWAALSGQEKENS